MSSRKKNKRFNPQAPPFTMPGSNQPASRSQIQWSTLKISATYIEKLRLLCNSQQELKREGYVLKSLDRQQIEAKLRCTKCRKRPSRKPSPQTESVLADVRRDPNKPFCDEKAGGCGKPGHTVDKCYRLHPDLMPKVMKDREARKTLRKGVAGKGLNEERRTGEEGLLEATGNAPAKKRSKACQYHIGRHFTCCNRHVSEEGCVEDDEHEMPPPNDPNVNEYWKYHYTPTAAPIHYRGRQPETRQPTLFNHWDAPYAPAPSSASTYLPPTTHLPAIALDCEMGTSKNGESELIRLTAVDFFSGAILIDNLVQPTVPMAHYNTRYSGVTQAAMCDAVRTGAAINGRDRARMALFQFVGPDTVLVVHGGSSDFTALRWIHPNIVDTFILEGYTGQKVEGGKSLQNLCKVKLGIDVQVRDPKMGKFGHDSYEDAMATRELAVQWVRAIPDV
ncbi:hypothetical protein H2200_005977 [Cladophialophora chaetospira]|uniref:Exonuclease domain-containing protein n=1 Tax=Cladophialophora chaetospira TaxID=386627 RepID=A0AA38XA30_9EURO|nr:hypothetical protein H2200_005977 [Cladophialophora chaetospira]